MRQWRVGTFSMGLVLVAIGITLLAAQFKQFSAIKTMLNWWPIVLVLLGAEILLFLKLVKEEQPTIKYDFLSIIFILFFGFTSLGLYGLTTTGVLDFFSEQVLVTSYELPLSEERLEVPAGVTKIQITGPRQRLKVLASSSNELVSFGSIDVRAVTKEEAWKLLPENIFKSRIVENTLFLEFQDVQGISDRGYNNYGGTMTLIVPDKISVELDMNGYGPLEMRLESLESNWLVRARNSVELVVPEHGNLEIKALVRHHDYLNGTVEWGGLEGKSENSSKEYYQGIVKRGAGGNKLQIISDGSVIVNTI